MIKPSKWNADEDLKELKMTKFIREQLLTTVIRRLLTLSINSCVPPLHRDKTSYKVSQRHL